MPSSHGREFPGRDVDMRPWQDRRRGAMLRSQSAGQRRVIASCWSRVRVSVAGLTAAPLRASRLAKFGAPISSSFPGIDFSFSLPFSWIPSFDREVLKMRRVRFELSEPQIAGSFLKCHLHRNDGRR